MSRQQYFPLQQLKAGLRQMQSSLNNAESTFSQDQVMVEYIRETQYGLSKILDRLNQYGTRA
jgi:hypothetical protein